MTEANPTIQEKFASLEKEINAATMERKDEVHGLMLAVLSKNHVFLLWPGGTAKSYLIDLLRKQVTGAKQFQRLMTRFTQPDEIFGPVKLSALKEDKFERNTDGKLPDAHFAFLDEIWKANSSIANSLLKIINEREFENNGTIMKVPLQTMLTASNELPGGEELDALYDRFLIKFVVGRVHEFDSFSNILKRNLPAPTTTVTLQELEQAQKDVEAVKLTDEVLKLMWQVREKLEHEGIEPSDRRMQWAVRVIQAHAYLRGNTETSPDDIEVLCDILWDNPEHYALIRRIVMELANPYLRQAEEFKDQAWAVWKAVQSTEDKKERLMVAAEEAKSLGDAKKELEKLKDAMAGSGRDMEKVEKYIREVDEIRSKITKMMVPV